MTEFAAPLPILARYAVMVDVGYIYAAAGELLFGSSSRRDFRVDAVPLIQVVTKHADEIIRGELLRVYWYDAARDRVPTIDQRVIAQMPWVKLRLGNLNARGQQKGVDAQIRADMEALARHRAITDAVLIAGDEDMVPAVEAAQAFGVRVHLWGIEPPYGTNQAEHLVWESDTVDVLDASFLRPYFTKNPLAVEQVRPDAAGALAVPSVRTNPLPGFATTPLGPSTEPGRVTRTLGDFATALEPGDSEYSVELSTPWSATHSGDVAVSAAPHGFFRSGSVSRASPGTSEARSAWFSVRLRWPRW